MSDEAKQHNSGEQDAASASELHAIRDETTNDLASLLEDYLKLAPSSEVGRETSDLLRDIYETPINTSEILSTYSDQALDIICTTVSEAENRHKRTLDKFGSVLLEHDPDGDDKWSHVPESHKEFFAQNISAASEEASGEVGDSLFKHLYGDEALVELIKVTAGYMMDSAKTVAEMVPKLDEDIEAILKISDDRVVFTCKLCLDTHIESASEILGTNSFEGSRLTKKAKRLNAALRAFRDNAVDVIPELLFEKTKEDLEQQSLDTFLAKIAEKNSATHAELTPPSKKERRAKRRAEYRKRKAEERARQEKESETSDEQRETVEQQSPAAEVDLSEEIMADVGTLPAQLPWLNDGESAPREVKKFSQNGKSVYIVDGMEPYMQDISEETRPKFASADNGDNRFDAITQYMARRINDGVMPWTSANSIKRVRNVDDSSEYADFSVWYYFELSSNAPRLYFTVMEAESLFADIEDSGIKSDDICVVVVAECDKSNQINVMKRITRRSRAALKSGGVGSV